MKLKRIIEIDNSLYDLGSKRCEIDLAQEIGKFRSHLKENVELYSTQIDKINKTLQSKRKHSSKEEYQTLSEKEKNNWDKLVEEANKEIKEVESKEVEINLEGYKLSKSLIISSEEKYGDIKKYEKLAFYIDGNVWTNLIDFIK